MHGQYYLYSFASLLALIASSFVSAAPTNETTSDAAAAVNHEPHVDLGYAIYKPTFYNIATIKDTGKYYNFSNIRYAAQPLGALRFSDPQPPENQRSLGVQDGTKANVCPQAAPASWNWRNVGIPDGQVIPIGNSTLPESEDCLFLDVVVPESVFKNGGKTKNGKLAPVMVNIHGGGFFIGDKATLYPPQGLIAASNNEMVFVSMNYRLTAFGFLGGLDKAASNTTSQNAGLLDQRMALKWIQQYIHLFGGDKSQVTIYGESGGGASVMFHAVAYGGAKETDLFHRVVGQSPGPQVGAPANQKKAGEAFLKALGVSSVDEARKLDTEVLKQANLDVERTLPYFGPLVDGNLVPDLPSQLYIKGRHVKNLQVMAGHNSNEALLFISPTQDSQAAFDAFLSFQFPTSSKEQIDYINNTLYPPPPAPGHDYDSQYQRLSLLDADVYNLCWATLLAATYAASGAHNYIFGVDPGLHAQDLSYTFYNGQAFQVDVNTTVAEVLQQAIANFVVYGDPNGQVDSHPAVVTQKRWDAATPGKYGSGNPALPLFPRWTADQAAVIKGGADAIRDAPVVNLTNGGFLESTEAAAGRCGWFFETGFANSN